jgi:enamine deaminase RidA (YjgF/YER057c/UK114 family)
MVKALHVNPPGTAPVQGLYSHVGVPSSGHGRIAFVAGQLSVGDDGAVVGRNDFAAQFAQVFANLQNVLAGLGTDCNSILKFTTYLVHSRYIDSFMSLRRELFPTLFAGSAYPPDTLLMVDRLVREEFLIEVEAIVVLDD